MTFKISIMGAQKNFPKKKKGAAAAKMPKAYKVLTNKKMFPESWLMGRDICRQHLKYFLFLLIFQ